MKIFDVTLPIHNDMLVWDGDPSVSIQQKTWVKKQGVRLSMFSFSSHTGTHIDAPNHFVENGVGIDKVPLGKLIGKCVVIDLSQTYSSSDPPAGGNSRSAGSRQARTIRSEIEVSDLSNFSIKKGAKILFKTGNFKLLTKKTFPKSYISLSLNAAQFLVEKKVDLVGTDFLGIEKRKNPGHPVHTTLLKAGVVIVEGLDLFGVPAGMYQLVCLPLRVIGADGSPARVVLIDS